MCQWCIDAVGQGHAVARQSADCVGACAGSQSRNTDKEMRFASGDDLPRHGGFRGSARLCGRRFAFEENALQR
jgi:hypothetical protein